MTIPPEIQKRADEIATAVANAVVAHPLNNLSPVQNHNIHAYTEEVIHNTIPLPQLLMCVEALRKLNALPNVENRIGGWIDVNKAIPECLEALTAYDDATKGKTI